MYSAAISNKKLKYAAKQQLEKNMAIMSFIVTLYVWPVNN